MEPDILNAVKVALKELVHPWEMLCGLIEFGNFLHPVIECKEKDGFNEHIDMYMNAPTPLIERDTGEIVYVPWYEDQINDDIQNGKYIKIQDKPKYLQEG